MSTLLPPPKATLLVNTRNGPPAISPDGAYVAFVANEEGTQSIWIRSLDAVTATRLPGTENGYYPFWSPDSRWLAFYANGKLRKVPVSGGAPQDICAVEQGRGGSWGRDGTILLTPKGRSSVISRVAEDGGSPVQITKFQEGIGSHRWPYFLPDGKHFLYLASPAGSLHPSNQIRMSSVDGKEDQLVLFAGSNPVFADGWLLFVRERKLMAAPMDGRSGKLTGEARALLSPVFYDSSYTSGAYSVSDNGILLYQSGRASNAELQWTRANGKTAGTLGSPGDYTGVRIAPDDKRVAVTLAQGSGVDVWVLDLLRSTATRVTFNGRIPASSVAWSPDERWVAYSANVGSSKIQLFRKSADGTGEEQPVSALSDRDEWLTDWSPDGRYLLFSALDPDTQLDVWAVPSDGSGKPFAVARGPHDELNGRFSPDGRWVAYVSNESGRNQVYLVPFAHGEGKWQVSTNGGDVVVWARDGKALYYTSGQNDMWAVRVVTHGDTVELSVPQQIFNTPIRTIFTGSNFDVTRDGRFLIDTAGATSDEPLVLVQNWKTLLNR